MILPRGSSPAPNQLHQSVVLLKSRDKAVLLLVAVIAAACCLRAPITCVGPLADAIQSDLGLSSGSMGTITTIPLLMFAAFSMVFGGLGRRHDAGGVILVGLAMILSGIVCRSLLGSWGLFLGTAVIGIGITAGNVLLPAIVKARFPGRIGALTGVYTAMMSMMSAVAGLVSVPIGDMVGWRGSLAVWSVLIAVTILLWIPNRGCRVDDHDEIGSAKDVLRSRTTWLLALYMGLQSLVYYTFVAWLSVIVQSKGLSPTEAGVVNSVFMVLGIVGSLAVPAIAGGRRDLRTMGAAVGTMYVAGVLLLIPDWGMVSLSAAILLCGLCGGACITFVTMMYALRTRSPGDSSTVSGASQSVGYLVAALGPVTAGAIHDLTSDWASPLLFVAAVTVVLVFLGGAIGRDTVIGEPRT